VQRGHLPGVRRGRIRRWLTQGESRGAASFARVWNQEFFFLFLFNLVLFYSNSNHFLLVLVVETLDLNQIESA
jgi:hypothetical protein